MAGYWIVARRLITGYWILHAGWTKFAFVAHSPYAETPGVPDPSAP